MRNLISMKYVLVCILHLFLVTSCRQAISIDNLTCEYSENPIAQENTHPALSWKIKGDGNNILQQKYRILVSDCKDSIDNNVGNIWDTGEVLSDQSVHVIYAGKTLQPYCTYFWKVCIEDQKGRKSPWSPNASWRQVPSQPDFSWIGWKNDTDRIDDVNSIFLRKTFNITELSKEPIYADIATPGYYELYINGKKVGSDVISPSCSGKDKRTFYVTYDIRPYLHKGNNTIGIWLGKGWYGLGPVPVAFRCMLINNQNEELLQTDSSWKAAPSPYSTLGSWDWAQFGGECCNANKNIEGWNLVDYDDSQWAFAQCLPQPSPSIEPQPCELNRIDDPISAASIRPLDNNCYEIDFGKNLTGLCSIQFPQLAQNDTIHMYFADVRWDSSRDIETPAGVIRRCSVGERIFTCQEDTFRYSTHNQHSIYIASDKGNEEFQSRFNPLGFRYIIVEGLKSAPTDPKAYMTETDLRRTGNFVCSDSLINRMHYTNDWTMRCLNQGAVYVDCPTRERLGYGDGQVAAESAIMNYQMPLFYRKFIKDWALRQDPITGAMPNVAPNYQGGGGIGWAGLMPAVTWRCYQYYGDKTLLQDMYPHMLKYLEYIETLCPDDIFRCRENDIQSIGDWVAPGRGMDTNNWPSPLMAEFFNNCYRVYLWDIQRKAALALDKKADADYCQAKLDKIRPLIHNHYYNADDSCYVSDEQSYFVMPLMVEVVPDSLKNKVWRRLEDNILNNGKLQTGMFGTYFLLQYLQNQDRSDLIYKLVAHQEYPGWGYMLSQGATTWWEQWNGFWSHIHSCFTSLDGWLYQGICGIRILEDYPGMKKFKVKPAYSLPLESASASITSMYGLIKSSWEKGNNQISLEIEIPANSNAEVYFPTSSADAITESGNPLASLEGVSQLSQSPMGISCLIPSGTYNFTIKKPSL